MNIKTIRQDGQVTLQLEGWLDTLAAPELGAAVDAIGEASAIILDFDQVEYIASAGLRQIVACHRRAKELGAAFSIINARGETMSIFQLTGIDKKITILKKES